MRAQIQFDQSEVNMDSCFFRNEAIKDEDDYILIGLVQDEVAELVPAHEDCANSRNDHVQPDALLGDFVPDLMRHRDDLAPHRQIAEHLAAMPDRRLGLRGRFHPAAMRAAAVFARRG
jgi:hypothetical protein